MGFALRSATGTVKLLSGQPKEGVSVEARSVSKGYYEEAVTDSSGSYRLRGLLPETTYVIKVINKDGLGTTRIERASPESVAVKVGPGDIRDLDFVVFEQPEMTIVSCHVEGQRKEELRSQLLVEIKSASDSSKVESVFELPVSNFFQVKNLPKAKHLLQLRTSLQSRTHKFESEIIEVDLERTAQIHVGPLRYSFVEDHQKQELTPAPVFPLIVGVSVIALFISMPRLKDLYQSTVGIPTPGFMTTAKREPRKPAPQMVNSVLYFWFVSGRGGRKRRIQMACVMLCPPSFNFSFDPPMPLLLSNNRSILRKAGLFS
ncbi:unnamed protein product [Dovyalis caffra]|uniref:DUF7152 domain-containing protein n=1 Tax=Dovyalis caffra TaxID=77055 RepID=A0AAV1SDI6_9ROSI|nr:unnamed protein product [Dovyalis caffra]